MSLAVLLARNQNMTLEDGVFTWKTLSGDVRDTLRL